MEHDDVEPPAKKIKSNVDDPDQKLPLAGIELDNVCDENHEESVPLPPELEAVDFSQRVAWGKYFPYTTDDQKLPLFPLDAEPIFTPESPALCHHVNAISGRARACTIHLKPQPGQASKPSRPVPTPIFMPVGTKGCLKGLTFHELTQDPAMQCPIILANTYHLALQPGTELLDEMGGLHSFQGLSNIDEAVETTLPENRATLPYNLLTDSGGFQMVSLVKLSEVSEEGVSFENPYKQQGKESKGRPDLSSQQSEAKDEEFNAGIQQPSPTEQDDTMMLLRPEDSIRHQHHIRANIIMALDDVVSSVNPNRSRMLTATHRTLRWYDRCYKAHHSPVPLHATEGESQHRNPALTQNLFPIVQGGLDSELGGLREQCLAGFRHRDLELKYMTPGYAIGGLAGGEEKDDFWRIIDQCCKALPDNKPRYLMGVGYPLDLVVCTALGVDMYDCVYPTRTARFGVALIPGKAPGTLRLKNNDCAPRIVVDGVISMSERILQWGCRCQACREGITRGRLHALFKAGNPVAVELLTQHNIAYMMSLVRNMRQAILEDRFAAFAVQFVKEQYPGKEAGGEDVPNWLVDALAAAGISLQDKAEAAHDV